MTTFAVCGTDVEELVDEMMTMYHGLLKEHGLTIDLLYAHAGTDANGDTVGCALKQNGMEKAALIKANSLKDRTKGMKDVELRIDGDKWPLYTDEQKRALIDHELMHVELQFTDSGALKRDDLDRPKVKMRPHDREVGWFDAVVKRHGKSAFEWASWNDIWQTFSQMELGFTDIG